MTAPPPHAGGQAYAGGQALAIIRRAPRVVLRHPVFATFADPFFRISEVERKPVLVIRLDDAQASLPLAGIMREFGIGRDDPDGVMFAMVTRALEFVTGLRIGDPLPSEILTGEASWAAADAYHDRAIARLNLQLIAWMAGDAPSGSRDTLSRAGQMSMSTDHLAAGLRRLSERIGGITPDEGIGRVRRVAGEFAHVEALRDQVLRGAQRLGAVLDRLGRGFRGDNTHKELLMQVRRLAVLGVADLQARFDAADHAIADIRAVASQPDHVIAAIRRHRDGLYVRGRAWEPYIVEWSTIEAGHNARTWHLAHDTYRFLAPRFMNMVEWLSTPPAGETPPARAAMVW